MAVQNGRLPASQLAPIAGGRLSKGAAAAWNAMNVEARQKHKVELRPTGSKSSYRTYAQQVELWNLYQTGKGNLAARPGTSNHGWGLAVDVPTQQMRTVIDKIGTKYGWAKKWSDAPSEWWHLKYRSGIWKGSDPGADGKKKPAAKKPPYPGHVLKQGSKGPNVKKAQARLTKKGYPTKADGDFGPQTTAATKKFQAAKKLTADGIIGKATWNKLWA